MFLHIQDLYKLRDTIKNQQTSGFCDVTTNCASLIIRNRPIGERVRILVYEWEDDGSADDFPNYAIETINDVLHRKGYVFVEFTNSTGDDKTLYHTFSLFLIGAHVFRLESYGEKGSSGVNLYPPRVVNWASWQHDITELLRIHLGSERIGLWNHLFSAREDVLSDTEWDINVVII